MNRERCDALGGCKEGLCEEGHLSHGSAEEGASENLGTESNRQRERSWCEGLRMGGAPCTQGRPEKGFGRKERVGCGHAVPIKGSGFYSPFIGHPLQCLKQGVT